MPPPLDHSEYYHILILESRAKPTKPLSYVADDMIEKWGLPYFELGKDHLHAIRFLLSGHG